MIKLGETLSLFFLFLSLNTIQIEGHDFNGTRTKREAETLGYATTVDDDTTNLCDYPAIDAAFYQGDRQCYFFIGAYYWATLDFKLQPGYPKIGRETWPGLPNKIDAAFSFNVNEVFFFSGSKYWKYKNNVLEPKHPKLIREGFPGIPDNIDAVSCWHKTQCLYFFKGSQYWKYDPKRVPPVKSMYPKAISDNWEGVPNDVDAVTFSLFNNPSDSTFIFKGRQFWRFDHTKMKVWTNQQGYSYPQPLFSSWFGCSQQDP